MNIVLGANGWEVSMEGVVPPSINGAVPVTDPPLTRKMVDTGTYTYIGYWVPGTPTNTAGAQVQRITNATGDKLYADSGNFSQIWDNYASLTYAV